MSRSLNALIITYYFPPADFGATNRLLRLLPLLAAKGLVYTVVTVGRDDTRHSSDKTLLDSLVNLRQIERTRSFEPFRSWDARTLRQTKTAEVAARNDMPPSKRAWPVRVLKPVAGIARRVTSVPDGSVGWYPFAVRSALAVCRHSKFDVIFSTIPAQTAHLVAQTVARATKLPWVADFRDAWLEYGREYNSLERAVSLRMLKGVIENASALSFTSIGMRRLFQSDYPAYAEKMHFIPHGIVNLPILEPVPKPQGEYWLGYIGTLDYARNPAPLFQALAFIRQTAPELYARVCVKVVGAVSQDIAEQIRTCEVCDRFQLLGFVSREESIRWMQSCDCLLILLSNISQIGYGASASKIYDYLGARKPILVMAPEGSVSEILRRTASGRAFLPAQGGQAGKWLVELMSGRTAVSYNEGGIQELSVENSAERLWGILRDSSGHD